MTYVEFIKKNKPQLIWNYIMRGSWNEGYSFAEFGTYIYEGFQKKVDWLPYEYTIGIKYYKQGEIEK